MLIFIIIIILPSAKIFTGVINESRFQVYVKEYASKNLIFDDAEVINQKTFYSDTLSLIDVYLIGESLQKNKIEYLNEKLKDYGLTNDGGFFNRFFSVTDKTVLRVHQGNDDSDTIFSQLSYLEKNLSQEVRIGIIEDIYKKNEEIIYSKDQQIKFLEDQIINLKKDTIPIQNITREVIIHFPKITNFGYGKTIEANHANEMDTIFSFLVKWNGFAWKAERKEQREKLEKWLKVRLDLDTLRVLEYK